MRATLQRFTMRLFKLGLIIFLLLAGVMVLTQVIGLLIGDAALVSGATTKLSRFMIVTAGLTGLLCFTMSYIFDWKSGGED